MRYSIAVEGGGTKLLGILYDETFRIINMVKTSGINTYFKSQDLVMENIQSVVTGLISNTIHEVDCLVVNFFCEISVTVVFKTFTKHIVVVDPYWASPHV